jgi:hypothetical protein
MRPTDCALPHLKPSSVAAVTLTQLSRGKKAYYATTLKDITDNAITVLDGWQQRELSAIPNRTNEASGDYRD